MIPTLAPLAYEIYTTFQRRVDERAEESAILDGYRWAMILEIRVALNLIPVAIGEVNSGNCEGMGDILESIQLPVTTACAMAMHSESADPEAFFDLVERESGLSGTDNTTNDRPEDLPTVDWLSLSVARFATIQTLATLSTLEADVQWVRRLERLREDFLATLKALLHWARSES